MYQFTEASIKSQDSFKLFNYIIEGVVARSASILEFSERNVFFLFISLHYIYRTYIWKNFKFLIGKIFRLENHTSEERVHYAGTRLGSVTPSYEAKPLLARGEATSLKWIIKWLYWSGVKFISNTKNTQKYNMYVQ